MLFFFARTLVLRLCDSSRCFQIMDSLIFNGLRILSLFCLNFATKNSPPHCFQIQKRDKHRKIFYSAGGSFLRLGILGVQP